MTTQGKSTSNAIDNNPVAEKAESLVTDKGGMPAQTIERPGLTKELDPQPDHGEESYEGAGKLKGLKALITGGDSGIGRATAIAYAREGADVAINYLPEEEEDAKDTAEWIEKAGQKAILVPGDVRKNKTVHEIVTKAVDELGGLDVLVLNAGTQMARGGEIEEADPEDIETVFLTNLHANFWFVQAALPHLHKGSSIIICTSIQAYDPSPALIDYAATKAALNNMTVNLAGTLGPKGIRVNAVAPGPIWTPLQPATQEEEKVEELGADTPLGRAGQPSEVAPAFVFLASPRDASYVSGAVLGVTGGKPVF